jgi:AsmA family protein
MKRAGILALLLAGLLVVLAAGALLTVAFVDANRLRGPVARMMSAHFGRPVRIDGALDLHLFSFTPTIGIGGLDIGNPRWAGPGSMMHAEHVIVQVKLLPLFKSTLIMPSVRIERPTLHLVRGLDGRVNWVSSRGEPGERGPPRFPVIQRFEMQPGEVTFRDLRRELDFRGIVSANEIAAKQDPRPFRLLGKGTMNGEPFRFNLRGASMMNVKADQPYPFDVNIVAGTTTVAAHGTIPKPFDLGRLEADFEMAGSDLADVYYLSGIAFPNTSPFRMSGRLSRTGMLISFRHLAGTIGDSDMRGDVAVELRGERRPLVMAKVSSQALDLDDALTWFGARRRAKQQGIQLKVPPRPPPPNANQRFFPDAKLKVKRVRAMDADVDYQAAAVQSGRVPIRALALKLKMQDGVMHFEPVSVSLPAGKITGVVQLDASEDVATTALDARVTGVQLSQFKSKKSTEAPFDGVLLGRVKLVGRGNSVHEFMGSSDGVATFVLPHGEVREVLAELTGINVVRGLGFALSNDQQKASVRCGVADLKASAGTLRIQNLVFDTNNVLITGQGDLNLASEQFDVRIKGEPKKLRLLRLKSPITIRGPMRHPSVGVEPDTKAMGQAGVAVALGALVTPLAAVVAFVDPGLAKDADCASLLAEAQAGGAPVKPTAGSD